jgi:DNA-directed RNA polymerase specialized sigma subunit
MKLRRNTIAEIDALLKLLRSRNKAKHDAGVAGLCTAFEPLIRSLVPKYEQPVSGSEPEDLEQVARLGLLEACKTFTRSKGAFPTHATWCIRHALSLYVASLGNPVRMPTTHSLRLSKLRRAAVKFAQEFGHEATAEELSEAMKLPIEVILTMLAYDVGPRPLDADAWVEQFPSDVPSPEMLVMVHEEAALRRQKEKR